MRTIEEILPLIPERVQAGVVFLNGICTDWIKRINVNYLILSSTRLCVGGQLASSLYDVEDERRFFFVFAGRNGLTDQQCIDYGLLSELQTYDSYNGRNFTREIMAEYQALTEEWRRVIRELQSQAEPQPIQDLPA